MISTKLRTAGLAIVAVLGLLASACGGDPPLELSDLASQGRQIANTSGCASCHGTNGQGVTAPTWQGIYDNPVELQDGTTVIADEQYLREAIADPSAKLRKDFAIKMPQNGLGDQEIDLIIAYISELR